MILSSRYPAILLAITLVSCFIAAPCSADSSNPSNAAKARALVQAAIKMTDSEKAVKLLWQATNIDPTLEEAYVYLGYYYNSRSDFANVVKVYQKLVKYQPDQVDAYLNIGEAYMSFSPPRMHQALGYYRKAYQLDSNSAFAALRIGQILAQEGNRNDAIRYLSKASAASAKHPGIAAQAQKMLDQMGGP